MIDPAFITAGALTGFVVGLTGVGGGALMTPILLLFFGIAPVTAIATDLWFAAITKLWWVPRCISARDRWIGRSSGACGWAAFRWRWGWSC